MGEEKGSGRIGFMGWLAGVCWYGLAVWVALEYTARALAPAWRAAGPGFAGAAIKFQGMLGLLVLLIVFVLVHLGSRRLSREAPTADSKATVQPPPKQFPTPPTLEVGVGVLSFAALSVAGVVAVLRVAPAMEVRQALLMTCAAGIGSSIATILGFLEHASEKKDFDPAYVAWYVGRPLMGLLLGLLFFFVVKGGLLLVLPNLAKLKDVELNPYGLAAIGGMVGLFSKHAIEKLQELFDVLFQTKSQAHDDAANQLRQAVLAKLPDDLKKQVEPLLPKPAPTPAQAQEDAANQLRQAVLAKLPDDLKKLVEPFLQKPAPAPAAATDTTPAAGDKDQGIR